MKTCPRCGFHHVDEDERCIRCGTFLETLGEVDPLAAADREVFDFDTGKGPRSRWWEGPLRLFATPLRWFSLLRMRMACPLPEDVGYRRPWIAGALSVIPGLGQLYNHQPKKAAILFVFVTLVFALAIATIYHPASNWILVGYVLAVVYAYNDGIVTAKRINQEWLPWQLGVAYYCAWIFYVCMLCLAIQFLGRHYVIKFRYISGDEVAPYLRKGEKIGVDCFTYTFLREPRIGDVVFYDPPTLKIENTTLLDGAMDKIQHHVDRINEMKADDPFGAYIYLKAVGGNAPLHNVLYVDPPNAVERIVAGPGQTFERRAGVFYRDGQPVPPEEEPLVTDQILQDFKLEAPEDAYLILFSYTGDVYDFVPANDLTSTDSLKFQIPRLDDPEWINQNWPEASVVPREGIVGRVWFVYQPPPARRWAR